MIPKPQIWYLCSNDLGTGYIRSFWPHLWQVTLVMYLYSQYATYSYVFCRRELSYIFLKPQIRYLCSNILETGHIRSFWPYFGQVRLVIYLYNRLVLCSYDFGRRELGYMFLEPQIWYLCLNDLEIGHIRSFWPHFWQVRLVMYLYSRYAPCSYYFGRKELGNMFPKP